MSMRPYDQVAMQLTNSLICCNQDRDSEAFQTCDHRRLCVDSKECPLVAVSSPSIYSIISDLNVRFGEKRTLSLRLPKLNRKTSALPSEADIALLASEL